MSAAQSLLAYLTADLVELPVMMNMPRSALPTKAPQSTSKISDLRCPNRTVVFFALKSDVEAHEPINASDNLFSSVHCSQCC